MEPEKNVEFLLDGDEPVDARSLIEASVHLPRRGRRWVASFRDETERRAFEKLRCHPALREFWSEWATGEIQEAGLGDSADWALTRAEIAAVYALARTPEERQALRTLLARTQGAEAGKFSAQDSR